MDTLPVETYFRAALLMVGMPFNPLPFTDLKTKLLLLPKTFLGIILEYNIDILVLYLYSQFMLHDWSVIKKFLVTKILILVHKVLFFFNNKTNSD